MPSEHPTGEALAAAFADDPLLRDFLAPIAVSTSGSLEETIARLAATVRWTRPSAEVQFTILQPSPARSWTLDLSRGGCRVGESRDELPDLEILTTADIFQKIFAGELAPLHAFGEGRLRVRGSLEIARALVRKLREAKAMLIEFTGTVECLVTSDGASFVEVKSATTAARELFVLFYASQGGATPVSAMWAATLAAARVSGKPVTIKHDEGSSRIRSLMIGESALI